LLSSPDIITHILRSAFAVTHTASVRGVIITTLLLILGLFNDAFSAA